MGGGVVSTPAPAPSAGYSTSSIPGREWGRLYLHPPLHPQLDTARVGSQAENGGVCIYTRPCTLSSIQHEWDPRQKMGVSVSTPAPAPSARYSTSGIPGRKWGCLYLHPPLHPQLDTARVGSQAENGGVCIYTRPCTLGSIQHEWDPRQKMGAFVSTPAPAPSARYSTSRIPGRKWGRLYLHPPLHPQLDTAREGSQAENGGVCIYTRPCTLGSIQHE